MCGLAGFIDPEGRLREPTRVLESMARCLMHRGPDDEGAHFDESTRVGLSFRRLAIIDITSTGHQPMRSASGRFEIVFNGECYGHHALRRELTQSGAQFRGTSDTETLLAAFEAWGIDATLPRLEGMFACAVLDRSKRELTLIRDRFGVKPMYYAFAGGREVPLGDFKNPVGATLAFASEIKALRALPGMSLTVDRNALALYLRHGYVPGPLTIHAEVRKLLPGHLLRYNLDERHGSCMRWFSSRDMVEHGARNPFRGSDADAVEAVDRALLESVRLRMESDVPLGAFLSGGTDSTAVVAAMQSLSTQRVKTYTIGFEGADYDESPFARKIAQHLGTEHTERIVTAEEARAVIPRIPEIWDEPFADSSQIPTLLVSETARQGVTVALSGDGGDELFGGYYRYAWTERIAQQNARVPLPLRHVAAYLLRAAPRRVGNAIGRAVAAALPARLQMDRAGDRAHKLAALLTHRDGWNLYLDLVATDRDSLALVPGATLPRTPLTDPTALADPTIVTDLCARMMQADIVSYLVDDILVKVDRASMSASLEAREPLLDSKLARLAFSLPSSMRIRNGERKWILKEVVARRVPRALTDRPKMGFGVPLGSWLRGPLKPWAESLLLGEDVARDDLLDAAQVRLRWQRFLRARDEGYDLWSILMFRAWSESWKCR